MSHGEVDVIVDDCRLAAVAAAVDDYRLACLSRALDDREITLLHQNRAFFQVSGAGHEAVLLALARQLRPGYDWFFPYYRDRALVLGLGVSAFEILLGSVGSAEDPASGGRQMPCHWSDRGRHIVSQSSPTGSQCLPAVGCAEAGRYINGRALHRCSAKSDELTYVSLGEGATSQGEFWESLNAACQMRLPVVFLVADNGWAISVPASRQSAAPVSELVRSYPNLHVSRFDGCDYFESWRASVSAVQHVRAGFGPALLHADVTRPYAHSQSDDQSKYRTGEDLDRERTRDPLVLLESALIAQGLLTPEEAQEIRLAAKREAAEAAQLAVAARRPDPTTTGDHLIAADAASPRCGEEEPSSDDEVLLGEAIRRALFEELDRDERLRVFGEDVADADVAILDYVPGKGGVFGITLGLQRRFGADRCFNTPLAEASIIGRAVGQAIRGLRPSPEIQFFDFIWPAMTQLRSEAATMRWRSNGAWTCPMVVRVPIGGYVRGGAIWHSQCGESIFTHIPGLQVLFPSRSVDAVGLLRTAFACEDPVLFLEHKHLYRQPRTQGSYPPPGWRLPLGRARRVTTGSALTVITWGATVYRAIDAAREVDPDRRWIELIDLRTLAPWDQDAVGDSIARTGRALVVHEDNVTCGFGAEIAAWIADECFEDLRAPVLRLGARDEPVAYEPELERATLPQPVDIARDMRHLLGY